MSCLSFPVVHVQPAWDCLRYKGHSIQLLIRFAAVLQAKKSNQQAATAQQTACAQKLQEAVETGKGKLAESAAFMRKLQDEQTRAKEQIAEYATQVLKRLQSHTLLQLVCDAEATSIWLPSVCTENQTVADAAQFATPSYQ